MFLLNMIKLSTFMNYFGFQCDLVFYIIILFSNPLVAEFGMSLSQYISLYRGVVNFTLRLTLQEKNSIL